MNRLGRGNGALCRTDRAHGAHGCDYGKRYPKIVYVTGGRGRDLPGAVCMRRKSDERSDEK